MNEEESALAKAATGDTDKAADAAVTQQLSDIESYFDLVDHAKMSASERGYVSDCLRCAFYEGLTFATRRASESIRAMGSK